MELTIIILGILIAFVIYFGIDMARELNRYIDYRNKKKKEELLKARRTLDNITND